MNLKIWNYLQESQSAFTRKLAIEFAESQCFWSCNCDLCLHHGNFNQKLILSKVNQSEQMETFSSLKSQRTFIKFDG